MVVNRARGWRTALTSSSAASSVKAEAAGSSASWREPTSRCMPAVSQP
ncbi:hypothetical protein [Pseudoduganella buxea]|uniref:Uncharacterized protein n=1 Tax=Pseudoduganella buxea TaxID=1949069 RepID=A0A6I3T3K0_9BURK|nr:hypothetical protein [Pseudoduganella buxea]MTV55052.1 hypothetical protein [Pseudoduganella buxea]